MSIKIKPLRKFTTGTPTTSDMEVGEIAVNTADKKVFMRDDSGGAGSIVEVGASSQLFTSGATTNIDINGRVTADEFRFKDSNTLLVSADYTGSSYLVQNEIQEILSITPDGNSQNYSIFGTISAASGANVHTLHINANLRSNTLPDLHFTQTYNEDLSVANTRYITPILFTKETATASMKLCVKIEAQIFGIVTANLVIVARSNDQLENVTVNTTEASEFTGTPTGFTERSFTRTYVVNGGNYELQSSNATKIEATSTGVEITGYPLITAGALGTTAGDTLELLDIRATQSNTSKLRVHTERDANGTDWQSAFTRIQQIIDVTEMGYIQFNGTGNTYGMEFGTNGDELFQKNVRNAQVELYWNGTKKFETASNGVTITGKLNGLTLPTGSGTLAKTSDITGIASVSADTNPSLGGDLDTAGNNITFGDSASASDDRLQLGSDQDLSIYHDGTDAYVSNKTGSLYIGANDDGDVGGDVYIRAKIGENDTSIQLLDDSSARIYVNGSLSATFASSNIQAHTGKISIEDIGANGTPTLNFNKGSPNTIDLVGVSTGARTINLPDASGTLVLGTTLFPSGTTTVGLPTPGAMNLANPPENDDHVFHPFLHNDLGHFIERGGSYAWAGLSATPSESATKTLFNASGDFVSINDSTISGSTYTLTLTDLPKGLSYSSYIGIVFGHHTFAPGSMVIETSTNNGTSWSTRLTDSSSKPVYTCTFDTGGTATNAIRFTLSAAPGSAQVRIQSIAAYNYNSAGMENYFLPLDGGTVYGDILATGGVSIGNADTTLTRNAAGSVQIEGHTILHNSNASMPSTTTSSGDADHVLINDGGFLKKISPANLGIGGGGGSPAADDITTGDAEVEIATNTGQITIDNQASDQDIVFKGNDGGSTITALTLDMSELGKAIFNDDMQLGTSGHYLTFDRGNTTITGVNNSLKLNSASGVQILYGGSTKITTNNTGADINGLLTVDGIRTDGTVRSHGYLNTYGSSSNPIVFTVTVLGQTSVHPYYNDGSTNKYLIDGIQGAALTLHGADNVTSNSQYYYRFDQSDNSNTGHPLRFYLEADKTTAYTTGVTTNGTPGQAGAYTQIAVTQDTPQILYYQCSQHGYMGNYVIVPHSTNIKQNSGNISLSATGGNIQLNGDTGNSVKVTGDLETTGSIQLGNQSDTTLSRSAAGTAQIEGNTILTLGNSDAPTTTTSSGDADFVLIDDGGTMKKITPANLGVGGGGGSFNGTLTSTDAGATANPVLTLDRNSASPAGGDVLGQVDFLGRNSAGETITYGSMGVKIEDASDGTEDSRLIYKVQNNGELKTVLDIKGAQLKVNNVNEVFFGDPVSALRFEGATGDPYELTLAITDPTGSDKTVTIPDATGTILTTGNSDEPATTTSSGDADFVLIDDGGTMKKISPANLGIGGGGGGSNQNAFSKFVVAGQTAVEADAVEDEVTLVGAGGVSITTNASNDTITFTGSGGASEAQAIAFAIALG